MGLECQNCGKELPDYPREEVERSSGKLDEIVAHSRVEESGAGWATTLTDYYCNPRCFIEAQMGG